MIVRKYDRRSRGITRSNSDSDFNDIVSDGFGESLSQESPQDIYNFTFSSQGSTHWSFDSEPYASNSSQESKQLTVLPPRKTLICGDFENGDGVFRKSKKAKNGKNRGAKVVPTKKFKSKELRSVPVEATAIATATLMETQGFGEMMEHLDEVNFALDGLRKGQPVRIRRASLLSLLSICGMAQQRRLLRTHGMAKKITDAVLGLTFDDSPSNLAAAALFYIFCSDGQDDYLLDSPSCIGFLIKLLKPLTSDATKNKAPTIGSKLLAFCKDSDTLHDTNNSTSAAIMLKVQEILVNCKEMKSRDGDGNIMEKPKLSPKWIALLTMEKACLSAISLEDTSGTLQKTGGNFKEKLRELGGLDEVFEIARNCHSTMEGWLKQSSSLLLESNNNVDLESLVLLLKCLKIMENATFLSKDNQSHLLGMKGNFNHQRFPQSLTKLILRFIKILSGVSLLKSSSGSSDDEKFCDFSNGIAHASELPLVADHKADSNEVIATSSAVRCCSMEWTSSQKSFHASQNSERLSSVQSGFCKSSSETVTTSLADTCFLKMRIDSSTSGSCSGTSRSSYYETCVSNNGSNMNFSHGKRVEFTNDKKLELLEDSQDPFAFDDDGFEPSKWDLLSGSKKVSKAPKNRVAIPEHEDGCQSLPILSQQESSNMEKCHSSEVSCLFAVDEEKSNLLADCLLTAVKVLMNLTNDNPVGCQQIAACGGLETLSSLIARHFPSFSSYLLPLDALRENSLSSKSSVEVDHQNDRHLTDQELDFLVAILGLLVNLVEKDSRNRSRLAAAGVSLPTLEGLEEDGQRDVIPLLCSIFLANQGAGEAAGEGKTLAWDDEEAVLQGEKEAEKMIVEALAALLLAFLSTESKSIRDSIAGCLPNHNLAILVPVLERFLDFHLTLDMISPETHTTVLEVIESCGMP